MELTVQELGSSAYLPPWLTLLRVSSPAGTAPVIHNTPPRTASCSGSSVEYGDFTALAFAYAYFFICQDSRFFSTSFLSQLLLKRYFQAQPEKLEKALDIVQCLGLSRGCCCVSLLLGPI